MIFPEEIQMFIPLSAWEQTPPAPEAIWPRLLTFRLTVVRSPRSYNLFYSCLEPGCKYRLSLPRIDLMQKHAAKHSGVLPEKVFHRRLQFRRIPASESWI